MTLGSYLPQDRLRALSRGESLPDRTFGSALFADISGFTALTEALRESLGPRHGAETLTKHLDAVYLELIVEIERWGGSVLDFAGDAILCWFDDADGFAAPRATTCALALQQVMQPFSAIALPNGSTMALSLKVAVATGSARRLMVGDPTIQTLDALAGATVTRTATAEHLARRGEVVSDETTANALGEALTIKEWRRDDESGERFAVVTQFAEQAVAPRLPASPRPPPVNKLMTWVHHGVFEREELGQESFLTEFRPCVALFVRFVGIDYDADDAQPQLDAFVRNTQKIAARYDGTLMDISIGDKGSYTYINFGALSTHEDNARRAVKAALTLEENAHTHARLAPLQIGITGGTLRVGAYGGNTRRTFGALGDDVNLAARLMMTAAPGEILVSGRVYQAVEHQFSVEPRPPVAMKGKVEPLPVFAVTAERRERAMRLQEPTYALPMVGREKELRLINDILDSTLAGKSRVIGIIAEAGMGKSRLVAELIRVARKKGFAGYGGACQSDAVNTPYQTWKSIWSAFFDLDPSAPLKKQIRLLEGELADRAPERVQAMPLLGVLLNLEIPDNDFTKTLEPKYRQSALRALLEECLRAGAQDEPVLIVIEDLHWIDALSHDLLEELARALSDSRVCFVLAYRPPQLARLEAPRLEALSNFTRIELRELNASEAEDAIRAKLAQLYPARTGAVPPVLVQKLMARSQGNPFYLEELLNFLRDRGLDPRNPADFEKIELPDSLHTLILSRIDRLSEHEKNTLRVASIVGRLFRAEWLTGYYPELGGAARVRTDLEQLSGMDFTPLNTPEPDLTYLFKHIVTHEVTYESLSFATRARLHEQLAQYLEKQIAAESFIESFLLDTLVYHYEHSDNQVKRREYLRKAARAAHEVSAFNTAVDYLARLLELTPAPDPNRSALALQLAEAYFSLSDFDAARVVVDEAQAAATTDADRASALAFLAEMEIQLGDYAKGLTILDNAVPLARASGQALPLCRALAALGSVNWRLNKLDDANSALSECLELAREMGNSSLELVALTRLGIVAGASGDLDQEERILQQVLARAVATGNREREMNSLNNLAVVADERGDIEVSHEYGLKALALAREIGAQQYVALYLINLAVDDIRRSEFASARASLREGLSLALRLGAIRSVVSGVIYFSELYHVEGRTERALALLGLARRQPAWSSENQRGMEGMLAEWALDPEVVEMGLTRGIELDWASTLDELIIG